MASLSRSLSRHQHDLEDQISHLKRELSKLGRAAGHVGADVRHDAAELGEALWKGGSAVARSVSRSAVGAGRAVRRDPVPAVAAAIAAACILSLVLSRK